MKLIRYQDAAGVIHYGRQHDDGRTTRIEGDILASYRDTGETANVVKTLAPIEARDIICIGLNYRKHAEEGKQAIPEQPVVFMKNLGSIQNPGDPIVLPRRLKSDAVDYECELAVVIGEPCLNVPRSEAYRYILGYTCANDVSARLAVEVGWRAMVPRQDLRHILSAGAVSGHVRRDRRSQLARDQDDLERPGHAGLEHQ